MVVAVGCLAVALPLAACGSDSSDGKSSGGGGSKDPISIGNISAMSGPILLPFGAQGAKAYFDALNKQGGINGRKVNYIVADDKSDPTAASQQARKLVQQNGIVGFAGGVSLVDCTVNGKFYQQQKIANVMGGASDPTCFTNPMISPVNTGVLTGVTAGLYYMGKTLGQVPSCTLNNNIPTINDAYGAAISRYEQLAGQKVAFQSHAVTPNSNLTTLMLQVKKAGCKSLVATFSGAQVPALVKAGKQVGWKGGLLLGGASYVASTPKALGADGEGVYTTSELYPYTSRDPILDPVKKDLKAAGVELTGLTEAGWLSAKIMADTIKGIKGDVTKASVLAALQKLTTYDTAGLTAQPYAFGPGDAHNPNQAIWPVVIKNGDWDPAATKFSTLPSS
ncbi:MAG TPA: ABC transporter substrate-binding protein [Baekduia sp.]|jgi:branched-chain amino acid transport system substrate-binding protein